LRRGRRPIWSWRRAVIEKLEKAGTLKAGSRVDLARVGVGVAVRAGAPQPNIATVDSVRTMLLAAKSIVHTSPDGSGFAGKAVARMIEQMGIADAIKPKLTIMQAIDGGVDLVAQAKPRSACSTSVKSCRCRASP
jgi:molybdate transport system substrate-binding protein